MVKQLGHAKHQYPPRSVWYSHAFLRHRHLCPNLHGEGSRLAAEPLRPHTILLELLCHAAELLEVRLPLLGFGELGDAFHPRRRVRELQETGRGRAGPGGLSLFRRFHISLEDRGGVSFLDRCIDIGRFSATMTLVLFFLRPLYRVPLSPSGIARLYRTREVHPWSSIGRHDRRSVNGKPSTGKPLCVIARK